MIEEAIQRLKEGKPITWREKYDPAMEILDQESAERYFEACVAHNMRSSTNNLGFAQAIERANLGYWAGYYSKQVRLRVEELFNCEHPVLGKAKDRDWTPDELIKAGMRESQKWLDRRSRKE